MQSVLNWPFESSFILLFIERNTKAKHCNGLTTTLRPFETVISFVTDVFQILEISGCTCGCFLSYYLMFMLPKVVAFNLNHKDLFRFTIHFMFNIG